MSSTNRWILWFLIYGASWIQRYLYIPSCVVALTSISKYILDRPCISFDLSAEIHFWEVGFTFQWIWYVLSSLSGWVHDYFIWIASFTFDATQAFTIFQYFLHLMGKYWLQDGKATIGKIDAQFWDGVEDCNLYFQEQPLRNVKFKPTVALCNVYSFQFLENTECWMKTGHSDWFLALPVLFTIVLNIFFLVRVVMILRCNFHGSHVESKSCSQKSARPSSSSRPSWSYFGQSFWNHFRSYELT